MVEHHDAIRRGGRGSPRSVRSVEADETRLGDGGPESVTTPARCRPDSEPDGHEADPGAGLVVGGDPTPPDERPRERLLHHLVGQTDITDGNGADEPHVLALHERREVVARSITRYTPAGAAGVTRPAEDLGGGHPSIPSMGDRQEEVRTTKVERRVDGAMVVTTRGSSPVPRLRSHLGCEPPAITMRTRFPRRSDGPPRRGRGG